MDVDWTIACHAVRGEGSASGGRAFRVPVSCAAARTLVRGQDWVPPRCRGVVHFVHGLSLICSPLAAVTKNSRTPVLRTKTLRVSTLHLGYLRGLSLNFYGYLLLCQRLSACELRRISMRKLLTRYCEKELNKFSIPSIHSIEQRL